MRRIACAASAHDGPKSASVGTNKVLERSIGVTRAPGGAVDEKAMIDTPAREEQWRRLYLGVRSKFLLALTIAIAWTALSVWLSQRWLVDLAEVTNWPFALIAIIFIAYVPGFMNAFLIATLSLDRRPTAHVSPIPASVMPTA